MLRLRRCTECHNVLKPDATLFGEPINPSVLSQSLEAARNCDLLLVVGTSAHVAPASGTWQQCTEHWQRLSCTGQFLLQSLFVLNCNTAASFNAVLKCQLSPAFLLVLIFHLV
jgi:NAD-dependent SIR2 family protein deacetylase